MKTKILPLVATLFCSPITLADQAFFNVTVGVPYTVVARANTFIEHTALTDVKLTNIRVNGGSCPIFRLSKIWVSDYAEELRLHRQSVSDVIYQGLVITKKGHTFNLMTRCSPEQINSVEITTDKGIQTVRFDIDVKPVITVKPLSEKKAAQIKKAPPSLLDTIYKVSNYTCYQTKDEIEGVIEMCSPLPANNVSEFTLPYGSLMSKPLFVERAKERARRARYIEFLETFPTEIPAFKEKRLPSVAIPSKGDTITGGRRDPHDERIEKLKRTDSEIDWAINSYESSLIELVRLKIDMPNLEAKVIDEKKAAVRIAKALEKNPGDQRLIDNAKEVESRILENLGSLENLATRIPEEEKDLAKNKIKVQDIQNEVIQLRSEIKAEEQANQTESINKENQNEASSTTGIETASQVNAEPQVREETKIEQQTEQVSSQIKEDQSSINDVMTHPQAVEIAVQIDTSEGIVVKRPDTTSPNIALADLKFLDGLAVFEDPNTGLKGYVNGDGNIVIKPQFTGAGGFYQGRAVVKNAQELWGYIDKSGNWVLSPQFCMAGRFSEGLAAVYVGGYHTETGDCLGGKWGYITQSGKMAIAPQFEQATYFSKNTKGVAVAKVTLDGYSGYINGKGEWVN